jgi:hypothetical protein
MADSTLPLLSYRVMSGAPCALLLRSGHAS